MKKILLICGGRSSEHDVSLTSCKSILENIDKTEYEPYCVVITHSGSWITNGKEVTNIIKYLQSFDVIFPILHGKNGEDGTIQGMLDLFNIPYVGSKCGTSYICMDKERTKQIINTLNIPQVPFQVYRENAKITIPFPIIVKPSSGGSSIGISVVHNKKELKKAIDNALKYDTKVVLEQYIQAKEIECAVLEDKKWVISEPGEIISANDWYDYEAKYENSNSKTLIPANIPKHIRKEIKNYAKKIVKHLDIHGLSRIDFFYDDINDKVYFNEINTIPGFTEISMYPQLIMNEGISYTDLITKLMKSAK